MKKLLAVLFWLMLYISPTAQTILSEDFENLTGNLPIGWTSFSTNPNQIDFATITKEELPSYNWDLKRSSGFAFLNLSNCWPCDLTDVFLETPPMDFTKVSDAMIYFEYLDYSGTINPFMIETSIDGGNSWSALDSYTSFIPETTWLNKYLPIGTHTNGEADVRLRFGYKDIDPIFQGLLLDNIKVMQPKDYDLKLNELERFDRWALINVNKAIDLTVTNFGKETVRKLGAYWDDGTKHFAEIDLILEPGQTKTILHPMPINYSEPCEKSIEVVITTLDGNEDQNPEDNSLILLHNRLSKNGDKNVVVEMGTSTLCGTCPSGISFIKEIQETFLDDIIGIFIHKEGPMSYPNYSTSANYYYLPQIHLDRFHDHVSLKHDHIKTYIGARTETSVPLDISIETSGSGQDISLSIETSFYTPLVDNDLRLSVVLLEQEVQGPSPAYDQANIYGTNNANHPYWSLFSNPIPASQIKYNDVARAILGTYEGEPGLFPKSIADGETTSAQFTFEIPEEYNRDQMTAVAMLIDGTTGEIINAKETYISENPISVKEIADNKFKIYPNPSNDFVNISFDKSGTYMLTITDLMGKLIQRQKVDIISSNHELKLPISQYPKGSYIISLMNEKHIQSKFLLIE